MGAFMADEPKKGMLDRLVERIGNLGNSGQTTAQSQAASLQSIADRFGGSGATCNANRPELMAIANNATNPVLSGAVNNCRDQVAAAGYTMKAPGS